MAGMGLSEKFLKEMGDNFNIDIAHELEEYMEQVRGPPCPETNRVRLKVSGGRLWSPGSSRALKSALMAA